MIQDQNKMQVKEQKTDKIFLSTVDRDPISSGSSARRGELKVNSASGWNARVPRLQGSDINSNIRALSMSVASGAWRPPFQETTGVCLLFAGMKQ